MEFVFPASAKNAATLCHADASELTSRRGLMPPSNASSPSNPNELLKSPQVTYPNGPTPTMRSTPGSYSNSNAFLIASGASTMMPGAEHLDAKAFTSMSEASPLVHTSDVSPILTGHTGGSADDEVDDETRHDLEAAGQGAQRATGRMKCKASTNLYVSNIADDIDDAALEQAFGIFGRVQSAKVMLNIHTGKSRGIGFVKFDTIESAYSALVAMHRYPLRGQKIAVRFADARADFRPLEKSPKIFIRNIPLNLALADLRAFFGQFGSLKHCTMHLDSAGFKAGGAGVRSRMAYVIYETAEEAEKALNAVHGTQPFSGGDALLMAKFAENEGQRNARRQQNKLDALTARRDAEARAAVAPTVSGVDAFMQPEPLLRTTVANGTVFTSAEPTARPTAAQYNAAAQPARNSTYGPIPPCGTSYAPMTQNPMAVAAKYTSTRSPPYSASQRPPPAYDATQGVQQQQAAAAAAAAMAAAAAAAAAANPLLAHPALAYYSSLMAPFYAAQYGAMPSPQGFATPAWQNAPSQSQRASCASSSPPGEQVHLHQTRSG